MGCWAGLRDAGQGYGVQGLGTLVRAKDVRARVRGWRMATTRFSMACQIAGRVGWGAGRSLGVEGGHGHPSMLRRVRGLERWVGCW